METIYHFITILFAIIMFDLQISTPNAILTFLLKSISKVSSVFVILYSGIQIFKYLGIL